MCKIRSCPNFIVKILIDYALSMKNYLWNIVQPIELLAIWKFLQTLWVFYSNGKNWITITYNGTWSTNFHSVATILDIVLVLVQWDHSTTPPFFGTLVLLSTDDNIFPPTFKVSRKYTCHASLFNVCLYLQYFVTLIFNIC